MIKLRKFGFFVPTFAAEFGGHGHAFGHEVVSKYVFEAESESYTKFFETSRLNFSKLKFLTGSEKCFEPEVERYIF